MPHRTLEPYPMSSHRHFDRRPSPPNAPPIATLSSTNSPTPSVSSLDRSSVSTPPIRRSSPHAQQYYSTHPQPYYSHPPPPPPVNHHHHNGHRGYDSHEGSPYTMPTALPPFATHSMSNAPPMGMDNAMGHGGGGGVPPTGRETYGLPSIPMSYQGGPISTNIPVVFTEDAATKLSDRVRRRCFNCCTSDTSTWRRSNLSPGKVLCNKCGLFERTHSRPRPEQFPHKRGPLASSVLHSRSPPTNHSQMPSPHMHNQTAPSQGQSPSMPNTLPPISGPPYSYSHPPHPSLAPLSSVAPPNGSYHASRREDDHQKPVTSNRPWQDRVSPPNSRRSSMNGNGNGKASPAPPPLSSGSAASTKSSRSRHDHGHRDDV